MYIKILPVLLLFAAPRTLTVRPQEIDDVLVNPGIGFTTFKRFNGDELISGEGWRDANPVVFQPFRGTLEMKRHPMTSVAYFRLYWNALEPKQGRFDWETLDFILRTARERGQTLMLRVAPYGRTTTDSNDVPGWYRALVGDESGLKLPEKWRTHPENPLYVRYWTRFIRELGKRYDGHPDLEAVDISLVGAWGEGDGVNTLREPTLNALLDAYLDTFRSTPLLMQMSVNPRAYAYALARRAVGWRADCLGNMSCVEGASSCHMFDLYPQRLVEFGLVDLWKKAPVSFESCWVMEHWKEHKWDLDYIIEQSLKWHISTFNNKSGAVPDEWRPQVDRWLKRMGYRFVLRKFSWPEAVTPGGELRFASWWENKGVAPCYRPYTLALRIASANRAHVLTSDADIRTWLPGDALANGVLSVPPDVTPGAYDLSIALLDPRTRQPAVRLAIAGREPDGWYKLGRIQIR